MAYILPLADDPDAETTGLWRVVSMIPIIPALLQVVLFLTVFRYDTPLFYKRKGDFENYKAVMNLLFINPKIEDTKEDKEDGAVEKQPEKEVVEMKEYESRDRLPPIHQNIRDDPQEALSSKSTDSKKDKNSDLEKTENKNSQNLERSQNGERLDSEQS